MLDAQQHKKLVRKPEIFVKGYSQIIQGSLPSSKLTWQLLEIHLNFSHRKCQATQNGGNFPLRGVSLPEGFFGTHFLEGIKLDAKVEFVTFGGISPKNRA